VSGAAMAGRLLTGGLNVKRCGRREEDRKRETYRQTDTEGRREGGEGDGLLVVFCSPSCLPGYRCVSIELHLIHVLTYVHVSALGEGLMHPSVCAFVAASRLTKLSVCLSVCLCLAYHKRHSSVCALVREWGEGFLIRFWCFVSCEVFCVCLMVQCVSVRRLAQGYWRIVP